MVVLKITHLWVVGLWGGWGAACVFMSGVPQAGRLLKRAGLINRLRDNYP